MTNEQINQRIAEACGWTEIHDSGPWHNHKPWGYPPQPPGTGGNAYKYVPDYCADLNAMHEAEMTLTEYQRESIYPRMMGGWRNPTKPIYATARQRAEAFLRTLGKWEEVQG